MSALVTALLVWLVVVSPLGGRAQPLGGVKDNRIAKKGAAMKCRDCRLFQKARPVMAETTSGRCHLRPYQEQNSHYATFRIVGEHDWCKEFQACHDTTLSDPKGWCKNG